MSSSVRVLCADLPGLIKRMVFALCETNIAFNDSIEITGSVHIRADETRVLALLLDHVTNKRRPAAASAECDDSDVADIAYNDTAAPAAAATASPRVSRSPGSTSSPQPLPSYGASVRHSTASSSDHPLPPLYANRSPASAMHSGAGRLQSTVRSTGGSGAVVAAPGNVHAHEAALQPSAVGGVAVPAASGGPCSASSASGAAVSAPQIALRPPESTVATSWGAPIHGVGDGGTYVRASPIAVATQSFERSYRGGPRPKVDRNIWDPDRSDIMASGSSISMASGSSISISGEDATSSYLPPADRASPSTAPPQLCSSSSSGGGGSSSGSMAGASAGETMYAAAMGRFVPPPIGGWAHAYRNAYQKVHLRKNGLSSHMCTLCGMHFQRAPSLAAHINAIHTRERSFKCELCNKVFFRRTAYCNHRRAHHQPGGSAGGYAGGALFSSSAAAATALALAESLEFAGGSGDGHRGSGGGSGGDGYADYADAADESEGGGSSADAAAWQSADSKEGLLLSGVGRIGGYEVDLPADTTAGGGGFSSSRVVASDAGDVDMMDSPPSGDSSIGEQQDVAVRKQDASSNRSSDRGSNDKSADH